MKGINRQGDRKGEKMLSLENRIKVHPFGIQATVMLLPEIY
jgi:hypothetical protein